MTGISRMLVGERFGRLVVVELVPDNKNPAAICRCDCGNMTKTQRGSLRNGRAKSCGCLKIEKFTERVKASRIYSDDERRERRSAASVAWQRENKDKYNARLRAWAEKNKGKIRSYGQARKESKSVYDREYRAKNVERLRDIRAVNSHKRRVKTKDQIGTVDKDIRKKLALAQRWKCAACLCSLRTVKAELDHITPIARGGAHDNKNLQLLCPYCNRSKGAKIPEDFMRQRGFLL